jgi:hypothetical protein
MAPTPTFQVVLTAGTAYSLRIELELLKQCFEPRPTKKDYIEEHV